MATIRLQRPSGFKDSSRYYIIFINGQQVGTIANDETKVFPTTVGQHIVTVKNDFFTRDISIDVNENQTKNLKVSGSKWGWTDSISLGIIILHFILVIFADFGYTIILLIPFVIAFVYDLIFRRQKFLTLEELNYN